MSRMESQTSVAVAFSQNPAVGEALQTKKVGDECELTLKARISELSADGAVLKIEALVPEGYEMADEEEESVAEPGAMPGAAVLGAADTTIPSAIASMVRRKKD